MSRLCPEAKTVTLKLCCLSTLNAPESFINNDNNIFHFSFKKQLLCNKCTAGGSNKLFNKIWTQWMSYASVSTEFKEHKSPLGSTHDQKCFFFYECYVKNVIFNANVNSVI